MWGKKSWTLASDQLKLHGIAACCIQVVLCTALQAAAYFAVYRQDKRLILAPIMFWLIPAVSAAMGIGSLLTMRPSLLALHSICGAAIAGASAIAQAGYQLLLLDRCARVQLSWQGCGMCTCSYKDECSKNTLAQDRLCASCQAWGTDVCSDINVATPFIMILACLSVLLVAVPVVYSSLLAVRLETEKGNLANKLQYARNLVSKELQHTDAPDGKATEPSPQLMELLRVMVAYGTPADYALATTCITLYNLKVHEVLGVEPDSLLATGGVRNSQVVPVEKQLELLRKSLAGLSDVDADEDEQIGTYDSRTQRTHRAARANLSPRADLQLQDFDATSGDSQAWNQQGSESVGNRSLNWSGGAGLQGPGWHAEGDENERGSGGGGRKGGKKPKRKKGSSKVKSDASALQRGQVVPEVEERYG